MNRFQLTLRGHIGFLALLAAASGSDSMAASLPPLQVDPALLGLPVAPRSPSVIPDSPAPAPSSAANPAPVQAPPPSPSILQSAPVTDAQKTIVPATVVPATVSPSAPAKPAAAPAAVATEPGPAASNSKPAALTVYLTADRINGVTSVETVAQGNVDMRRGERSLKTDRLVYREPLDEIEASGNVMLTAPGETISGPHLKLKLGESVGSFDSPTYSINRLNSGDPNAKAHGQATRLDFEGEDRYRLHDATYSTCPVSSSAPDWFARVSDMSLDYTSSEGVGKHTTVVFKGVPILYLPWMSFPLDNQRKTGLLTPTIGSSSKSGFEVTQPFYWNIAPDMDATLAPRFMSKRGMQLSAEYRYLGQSYAGQVAGEYLGDDQLSHTNRRALTMLHHQDFGHGFSGSLNLNGVSDDTYFTDLSTRLSNITQTNLLREGRLNYDAGWWSASVMAQRFQTLQDPSQPPLAIPYDRLPQLLVSAMRPDLPWGSELDFSAEHVNFSHPTGAAVEGKRITLYPQLSYPIQTAAYRVTPKLGFHSTQYQLRQQGAGIPDNLSRSLPVFSLDGSVIFERPLQLFNQELTQTLEPRAYYLKVPRRDQTKIPLFDTGLADFNFAQIFSENAFSGGDRVSDANQLTVAATSRVIDTASGEELLRGALGQRYYFSDQTTTLCAPNNPVCAPPRTERIADLLAALSGRLNREVYLDSGVQYNNQDNEVERLNFGARYQPEPGKVVNAGYRYTRALLRQIDTSAQWPLFGGWHAVGRYNYSLRDKRVIEAIAGLEYDGGCWAARFVTQRLATAVGQANNSIFVQLELSGFSDIGSNPLNLLRRNIPGYGHITQSPADPVFAE